MVYWSYFGWWFFCCGWGPCVQGWQVAVVQVRSLVWLAGQIVLTLVCSPPQRHALRNANGADVNRANAASGFEEGEVGTADDKLGNQEHPGWRYLAKRGPFLCVARVARHGSDRAAPCAASFSCICMHLFPA